MTQYKAGRVAVEHVKNPSRVQKHEDSLAAMRRRILLLKGKEFTSRDVSEGMRYAYELLRALLAAEEIAVVRTASGVGNKGGGCISIYRATRRLALPKPGTGMSFDAFKPVFPELFRDPGTPGRYFRHTLGKED